MNKVLKNTSNTLRYFFRCNFVLLPKLMVLVCPFLTLGLYFNIYDLNFGKWFTSFILAVFVCLWIAIADALKLKASKLNIGEDVPVPAKRFTKPDGLGNVSVSYEEIDDMILYVYDVEQYLESRGLL